VKESWNLTKVVDREDIDIVTKWVLLIIGSAGVVIAAIAHAYPVENPDALILSILGILLIVKGLGLGQFIQMPWKTYFWIYSTVLILFPFYIFFRIDDIHKMIPIEDYGSLLLAWIGIAAIYGFVYKKVFLNQKFWKATFILFIVLFFYYATKLIHVGSFSPVAIGWVYLTILLLAPSYYAFGVYAFNREAAINDTNIRQWDFLSIENKGSNKDGILTLIYFCLGFLIVYFFRGHDSQIILFIGIFGMLYCFGMAMKSGGRYIHYIYNTPEEAKRKRLMKD